ncbi:unnamed protein product [Rotaria socialis]|uniref:Uncharacterized protein n=1 Tax=Rotaria socialis TaxID=392032 RepID=A0A818DT38_9BILA|nr:unnamed protein product [Rotaria socialis]CAF3449879.1 unnamed protein product [Rotaria socialis]CAF3451564.1 unnamed protein product [Rotaria socialis]
MATVITTNDNVYSNGSSPSNFKMIHDWFLSLQGEMVSSTLNYNPKLNAEIHLAITKESSEYVSSICDHLFSLYHDVQHRLFVLQFLPSFVAVYYDVLYHHRHLESIDAKTEDVCSTIDTFLVSLYNLTVMDDEHNEKTYEFRIPNLTLPSIYHTPNSDHYAPTPLTQQAISKHEQKCEAIRLPSFTPFDSINGTTNSSKLMISYQGEQIVWFLLIQYGINVSFMDKYSRQSYIRMSKKLVGQGFSFNGAKQSKTQSVLPPDGRRIRVSSRIMSEILGTLFYFKFNTSDKEVDECLHLLKHRAEYEMYADVLLMTESMGYLHEFESKRSEQADRMGIEIELPPTMDMVRQKRTATTTRSIKNRQRSKNQNDVSVLTETSTDENTNIIPVSPQQQSITSLANQNLSIFDYNHVNHADDFESSLMIDEARSNISSSIGPAISTPSPSSARHYTPVSLTSTQTYFKTLQQQRGSSPILQLQPMKFDDNGGDGDNEPVTVTTVPHSSSMKHGGKKDRLATVRFRGDKSEDKETNVEETYL